MNNHGRSKLEQDGYWKHDGPEWGLIDQVVHDEIAQTKVAAKFIPLRLSPGVMVTPADTIDPVRMMVNPGATDPLVEIFVEFSLTSEQAHKEGDLHTAATLATRAANLLSQAEDLLVFQGQEVNKSDRFKKLHVQVQGGPAGPGLLKSAGETIPVKPIDVGARKYGEHTFAAVARGYSDLQGNGQYGPYALVLPTIPYADAYAPLRDTLVTPADRIKPLVTAGFFGTGTLPAPDGSNHGDPFQGVLVSLGGNTMDIVVGQEAITEFEQEDHGRLLFRVYERFALRPKENAAIVELEFETKLGK